MGLVERSWLEIVAHIPRNLGSGETLSTELSTGRLGFKLSHIQFDWLKSGCVAVGLFFGSNTVWLELLNGSSRNCSLKIRQDKYGKIKTDEEQNYRDDKAFGYKLFVTIIHSSILRLHWRHLISSYWYSPAIFDQLLGF
jgi:hypothetical protein